MKKKLVEQMKAPRITKDMEGIVAIARMPAEGTLTIDIIDADTKEIELRHCVTKKEFANYYPESGRWDNRKLNSIDGYRYDAHYMFASLYGKTNVQKVLGIKIETLQDIERFEYDLQKNKECDKHRRLIDKCKKRNEQVPKPTDKETEFLQRYVNGYKIIYYKRKGRKVKVACSECGKSGEYIVHPETLEEFAGHYLDFTPSHNMGGQPCPLCGNISVWKAAGRTKKMQTYIDHRYIINNVEGNVVVRHFEIIKDVFGNEEGATYKVYLTETVRAWFFKDGGYQRDYHKCGRFKGEEFWDYKNLAGMANILTHAGKTYSGNLDCLKGTEFEYSQLEKEIVRNDYTDPIEYLNVYRKYPCIEMLEKLGMTRIKSWLLKEGRWSNRIDGKEKDPEKIFKITKQRFYDLRKKNSGIELLELYQMEKKNGVHITPEQEELIEQTNMKISDMETITKHVNLGKALNYIRKKATRRDIKEIATTYADYINLLEKNGRDMTEIELFPRDLDGVHKKEILFANKLEMEREGEQKNKKNPNIKKDAPAYNRKYRYTSKDYVIRAPKDAKEILEEGMVLNNCVGRAGYIESMNRHDTVILFLRKRVNKDVPYYTLEVKGGKLVQAYGKGNKKPDWESVNAFLQEFKKAKLKKQEERKVG